MRIRLGQTVCGTCSVADNGISHANHQVCVVTDSSVMYTFSLTHFFQKVNVSKPNPKPDLKFWCLGAKSLYLNFKVLPNPQALILPWYSSINPVTVVTYFTINISNWCHLLLKNGGIVSNNRNVATLQITNQYVLIIVLSILLLLWPTVCCTRIKWGWNIDNISIKFVQW